MKPLLTIAALFVLVSYGQAQKFFIPVNEYAMPQSGNGNMSVIVSMPIGSSDIQSISGDTAALRLAGPIVIDVVCTDYPSNASLTALNQARFRQVFRAFPYLDKKNVQQVGFYRQMKGSTLEMAKTMFHGFIIKFRLAQSATSMKEDLQKLDEILDKVMPPATGKKKSTGKKDGDALSYTEDDSGLPDNNILITTTDELTVYQQDVVVLADPRDKVKEWERNGILKGDRVVWIKGHDIGDYFRPGNNYTSLLQKRNDSVALIITSKKKWYRETFGDPVPVTKKRRLNLDSIGMTGYEAPGFSDSTILKTFQRNNWKNYVVLADVTGSMYPYSAQLLIWMKMSIARNGAGRIIAFNDGDGKRDADKIAGSTGGIHAQVCKTFDEAKELLRSTMRKGGGGDAPENNIEALLQAEKLFPDAAFNVMIADNWAPIKDKSLMYQLTKPVRVVLCGVYNNGINADYLNLARITKGSLHLLESDLTNLAAANESEVVQVGSRKYKVIDNTFVDVTDEKMVFVK